VLTGREGLLLTERPEAPKIGKGWPIYQGGTIRQQHRGQNGGKEAKRRYCLVGGSEKKKIDE